MHSITHTQKSLDLECSGVLHIYPYIYTTRLKVGICPELKLVTSNLCK